MNKGKNSNIIITLEPFQNRPLHLLDENRVLIHKLLQRPANNPQTTCQPSVCIGVEKNDMGKVS